MPKQTIYIANPADLSLRNGQLLLQRDGTEDVIRSIEDLRILIIDHHSVHITVPLINKLAENNVAVVFCNENHTPVTMTLDLESNYQQTKFFRAQLEVTVPTKKQLWKQIVESKIRNQSRLLNKLQKGNDCLREYYMHVRSGDSSNREGIAAKIYWKKLFGNDFIRDRSAPPPNNLLNFGYAILRSYMARAVMDAGLFPSAGIFHKSYFNSFPLVDDIMEPYRPYVDELVYTTYIKGKRDIDKAFKHNVLNLFYSTLSYDMLLNTTHSLAKVYSKESQYVYFPIIS